MRRAGWVLAGGAVLLLATGMYHRFKALPPGISFAGPKRATSDVRFLRDLTFVNEAGEREVEQEIFDVVFAMIDRAERFILVDMFLFNDFQGARPERTRALHRELTDHLLARKRAVPAVEIHLITDPINTVYGGLRSAHLEELKAAGVNVTLTDLARLRDSNAVYSSFWRCFISPFGSGEGRMLRNPFGDGRVSLRAGLALPNFKANHRKVIVTDGPDGLTGLVTSANPHDGSSAHQNVALQFNGAAAVDLLAAEQAVLRFSGGPTVKFTPPIPAGSGEDDRALRLQVVSENEIERAALGLFAGLDSGSTIDLMMFYLSDRAIIDGLNAAAGQGAAIRLILDPNKDAFGLEKNGIPNRPVAAELSEVTGITIRWADTRGEQCHSKMLLVRDGGGRAALLLGSANFTRRNLDDFNLELNVVVEGPAEAAALARAGDYFDAAWTNAGDRRFTVPYEAYRDDSAWRYWRYRVMERTGLSTF
jgi:phosphatidylserine/phosphatidylglycerophosphate/cardiolipin synthase-like enzyme